MAVEAVLVQGRHTFIILRRTELIGSMEYGFLVLFGLWLIREFTCQLVSGITRMHEIEMPLSYSVI